MTDYLSVYMTASTPEEAETIAEALIEANLAACVNILPKATSLYKWKGKTERAPECVFIAKTTVEKFDALQKRVKELHSYECPCIVATPIVAGNKDYLEWIEKG